jgi:anti-sigma B factor antagonist
LAMPDNDVEPWPDALFRAQATGDDSDPVVIIEGELDASSTDWFVACVAAALEKHPTSIAIDAGGLSYMDSSGLRSLLIARAAAEEAGVSLRITQPSPAVRHLVERTGLQNRLLDE